MPCLIARVLETGFAVGDDRTSRLRTPRSRVVTAQQQQKRTFAKIVTTEVGGARHRGSSTATPHSIRVLVSTWSGSATVAASQPFRQWPRAHHRGDPRPSGETFGTWGFQGHDQPDHRRHRRRHGGLGSPPRDPIYAVVLIDAIVIKVCDTQVATGPSTWRSESISTANAMSLGLWMGLLRRRPSSG